VLKNKSIISENIGGLVTTGRKQDWHDIFKENMANLKEEKEAKAVEKEPTKDVVDMETKGYDYKDKKNYDNVFGEEFLKGFYTEMGDSKNEGKTVEELRAIVAKNLAKDMNYYVKDGQFGLKGVGYTTEAPGLGTPKEAKGKHKSSGYGDLKESVLRALISETIKEVLNENHKKGDKVKFLDKTWTVTGTHVDSDGDKFYDIELDGKKHKDVPASALKEGLTPEDEMVFSQAVDFAEDLYDKVGNVEDVLANLPKQYIRFKDELEQHLTQKFEG
jgi:hypothetical protein